jgi:hypothetical protein
MSLQTTVMLTLAAVLIVAADGPMVASPCPTRIKQANDRIAGMDQTSEKVQQAKALVAAADRLHTAGHHYLSFATAQAALDGLR